VELLNNGSSIIVGNDPQRIKDGFRVLLRGSSEFEYPPLYGDGKASSFITEEILKYFE
jgi:UDP-N-acetylglucosamine 2-epimerase